jgi:hypothetical protein
MLRLASTGEASFTFPILSKQALSPKKMSNGLPSIAFHPAYPSHLLK